MNNDTLKLKIKRTGIASASGSTNSMFHSFFCFHPAYMAKCNLACWLPWHEARIYPHPSMLAIRLRRELCVERDHFHSKPCELKGALWCWHISFVWALPQRLEENSPSSTTHSTDSSFTLRPPYMVVPNRCRCHRSRGSPKPSGLPRTRDCSDHRCWASPSFSGNCLGTWGENDGRQ